MPVARKPESERKVFLNWEQSEVGGPRWKKVRPDSHPSVINV